MASLYRDCRLHILSNILSTVDRGDFAALVMLDLSAAFDTVDHDILLQRLQTSFGIGGAALKWFQSYVTGRTQHVRRGAARSTTTRLICGVPQGSVLGPTMFIMYITADLVSLIQQHRPSPHLYADDTYMARVCHLTSTAYFWSFDWLDRDCTVFYCP